MNEPGKSSDTLPIAQGLHGVGGQLSPFDVGIAVGFMTDAGAGYVYDHGYRQKVIDDCMWVFSWSITKASVWYKIGFSCVDINLKYCKACPGEKHDNAGRAVTVTQCFFAGVSPDDLKGINIAELFLQQLQVQFPPP